MSDKLKILERDPWLEPFEGDLKFRINEFERTKRRLLGNNLELSLIEFAEGYKYFGFHQEDESWVYREWAPNPAITNVYLVGDFNDWNGIQHELKSHKSGVWELRVLGKMPLGSRVKVQLIVNSASLWRVPTYANYVEQQPDLSFAQVLYQPTYKFKHTEPKITEAPLIYEAHIGISTEEYRINSYAEFTRDVLPRIKADGYNTIQLMAIQEHPLYSSFGYQVSNFYAASSRFGKPDDLMALIDQAHGLGLRVLLDVVHSHAVKNVGEGLNLFDGTTRQFFHDGVRGEHPTWNTKLFNYGKDEVIHFLLSNLKFWLDVYRFDGFRFDGVTSMLYRDHGLGTSFDAYVKYFSMNTDIEAVSYLMMATELVHNYRSDAICIAEDMSAMPGMALPISEGGIGFDYRLSMGVPDYWIKQLKTKTDDQLDLMRLWWELTTRRPGEKNIGYAESHDQALVGDKTLMFRLADAEMYWSMDIQSSSIAIDRAMALHKMIRLITFSLAGEGYLNFMGNEFGHPEWLDFPRPGNGDSYQHARRQWSLSTNPELRFQYLLAFDNSMIQLEHDYKFLEEVSRLEQKWIQNSDKILAYQKGNLLFAYNFHPRDSKSMIFEFSSVELILDSDDTKFGGFGPRNDFKFEGGKLEIKLASRTAMVFKLK
ncbi:alpha-amylase family glycosyl hydrolase [Lactovum miscens]|uniref:1,4-alpha-glucan branching enzyme n=1 Tax=Lactovum miscens TaxID=190387 RepID=A0A841C531_9LACT|nr:alpha-amylase family glycosyl hydrolase [Lactovum miscens]MBB5887377.1 1,4-alpha-glucan branching enzyme [Lactovum miscens]